MLNSPMSRSIQSGFVRTLILVSSLFLLSAVAGAQETTPCTDCHDVTIAADTAHAKVECLSCHEGREEVPHPEGLEPKPCGTCHFNQADQFALGYHGRARASGNDMAPDCGVCHGEAHAIQRPGTTPFRREEVELCSTCHPDEGDKFALSIHGQAIEKGNRQAPTCVTCHGEHDNEPVQPGKIRQTCAKCHGSVALAAQFGFPSDRIVSYDQSYHGLALKAGSQTVANCASCHGVHQILPSSDPRSMINPNNLPQTCGKCHPGAGTRFEIAPVHVVQGQGQDPIADLFRMIYLFLIPITLGLMLIHNLGDWLRKLQIRARTPNFIHQRILEVRMLPLERVQHALLASSFIVLTWSGFALKWPNQFWAWPLTAPGAPFRGTVHRIAAVVFIIAAILHVILLISHRTLRRRWTELLPRGRDINEAVANFAYNVGLRKERPVIAEHSYIEKAEYWAVVWGGVVMSITGIMLWAETTSMRLLPTWFMDVATVIHYYEAVLAALAIVIWHFYSVIFDPNVYPMSMAWLTGKGPARSYMEEHEEPGEPPAPHSPTERKH